ncbi:PQQ-binding-like beta-propeller repeat protein [Hamadaea sp.]|uniref:outer membrane protein assembly factor BamB family protein n=1 Tax=Hamadaea sp. TaxID=2024425 RepID=UPI003443174B
MITAAGLAVLAILVLATVILRGTAPDPNPPQPVAPTSSPIAFRKMEQAGGAGVKVPKSVDFTMSSVVGDRGFVAWRGPTGLLGIGALDVRTGDPLWPSLTLPGVFDDWNGMIALPNAVVSIGERNDGSALDQELFVVDPATGKLRWHRGMNINGFDMLAYPDVLVLADRDGKKTTAYDWLTGQPAWTFDGEIASTFSMRTASDLTGPAGRRSGPFAAEDHGDTLFQVDGAGTLTEYAVATGKPTGRSWPDAGSGDFLAYEGRVYQTTGTSLRALTLEPGRKWERLYEAQVPVESADNANRLQNLTPCGRLMCLVDGDLFQADVVALNWSKVVWRTRVKDTEDLLAVGDHLVVYGGGPDRPSNLLLDSQGKDVLTEAERAGYPMRVNASSMFLYHDGHLFGLDLGTLARTDLGAFEVTGLGPGIGAKALITQIGDHFVVYRFSD